MGDWLDITSYSGTVKEAAKHPHVRVGWLGWLTGAVLVPVGLWGDSPWVVAGGSLFIAGMAGNAVRRARRRRLYRQIGSRP